MLPAENISATEYDGSIASVSGSSYAVSRLAALAARILIHSPAISVDDLKKAIASISTVGETKQYVSTGFLDPLGDSVISVVEAGASFTLGELADADSQVPLNLVVLNQSWNTKKVKDTLERAKLILSQCGFDIPSANFINIKGADYISNLSPASALTLHKVLKNTQTVGYVESAITVFFANDTDMQFKFDAEAFGLGNTRTRPWMQHTVWITKSITHSGIAMAHELYHVLANNGNHTTEEGNLMRSDTSGANISLTEHQCKQAMELGRENKLAIPVNSNGAKK